MASTALNRLSEQLATLPPGAVWVGFSGGLDSTVLLHLLAALPAARARGLSALHVCHGLHPDAEAWTQHCARFAAMLDVPFHRADVTVTGMAEEGMEAAARRARHGAFAQRLPAPGVLALAHHRDDQAETLLLRLLHGAGHEGLAGMRVLRPLLRDKLQRDDMARWLWRPLLDVPRTVLVDHAREHALDYIDDPANDDPRHARNRVRHITLPSMNVAFPDATARIAATASRLREEADALDALAFDLLQRHRDAGDGSLACEPLRTSPPALTRRVVGAWLDASDLPRPPPGIWSRLHADLINARPDATPVLAWHGARLRRHRDRLHADDGSHEPDADWTLHWDGTTPLALPNAAGTLTLEPASPHPMNWQVRPRRGGERLHLNGHHHSVKKLLQESGLPPWQRDALPLLFDADGRLLSIAGRWNDDAFSHWLAHSGTRLLLHHD